MHPRQTPETECTQKDMQSEASEPNHHGGGSLMINGPLAENIRVLATG